MRFFVLLFVWLGCLCDGYSQVNFPIDPYVPSEEPEEAIAQHRTKGPQTLQQFADGLILKSEISNANPVKNELVQVRWVLYYPNSPKLDVDYKIVEYSLPNLPDFVKEWNIIVDDDDKESVRSVKVEGMDYRCRTLLCFYMMPADVGSFSLSKGSLSLQLYDGKGSAFGKPIPLVSASRSIKVIDLINQPDSFSNAIGQFRLTSELVNADSVFCGKPFIYRVKLSGSGNFKFINSPQISFPDNFEVHRLQPVNRVSYSSVKSEGEMVFDYYLNPQKTGTFVIPDASICFYNPALKKYQIAKAEGMKVVVRSSANTDQESLDSLYNKTEPICSNTTAEGRSFIVIFILVAIVVALIGLLFYKRVSDKQIKAKSIDYEEIALAAMMEANSSLHGEVFYKKVIDLLLDYISNKLNYRVATQSKQVLAEILLENGISQHKVERVIYLINYCEQVCYSQSRDFSNKEMVNDLFCDVIDDLKVDFGKSVNCSKLQ